MIRRRMFTDGTTWESADSRLPSKPVVSTVMLTYNHAPYLAQAVEGVLEQRQRFASELIISDDCSTDATLDIALDAQKANPGLIRVIGGRTNIGMIGNHMRVLAAASREVCGVLRR